MKKIELYKTPCNSMYKPYSIMELRNRTLANVTSKITELVLEPYIAVRKVDFVRLDRN